MMKISRAGFTLAEVLTTLMVIGVVAAMTIPTLMNNTTDQQFRVAYRKAMSVLGQGAQLMVAREIECGISAANANGDLAACMSNVLAGSRASYDANGVEADADGNVIITSDGMAYAFYYLGPEFNGTRSLATICGRSNTQFGSAQTDYDGSNALCLVTVDFNGTSRGAKTFQDIAGGGALTDANLEGEDQQILHLTGDGVRPVWIGGEGGSADAMANQGYQYMYGEGNSPFEAAPAGG